MPAFPRVRHPAHAPKRRGRYPYDAPGSVGQHSALPAERFSDRENAGLVYEPKRKVYAQELEQVQRGAQQRSGWNDCSGAHNFKLYCTVHVSGRCSVLCVVFMS